MLLLASTDAGKHRGMSSSVLARLETPSGIRKQSSLHVSDLLTPSGKGWVGRNSKAPLSAHDKQQLWFGALFPIPPLQAQADSGGLGKPSGQHGLWAAKEMRTFEVGISASSACLSALMKTFRCHPNGPARLPIVAMQIQQECFLWKNVTCRNHNAGWTILLLFLSDVSILIAAYKVIISYCCNKG